MIKNERQYRITRAQAEKFARALTHMDEHPEETASVGPRLRSAMKDALANQLADLREEMEEYETLKSGHRRVFELDSFAELPRALIQSRIALGLSQKDLAERLGLKEQQIQRYEATEYAGASVQRLKEVIQALGVQVREEVALPDTRPHPDSGADARPA
jgi:ribosome-binding protein aMBF1 (putative translation factor)